VLKETLNKAKTKFLTVVPEIGNSKFNEERVVKKRMVVVLIVTCLFAGCTTSGVSVPATVIVDTAVSLDDALKQFAEQIESRLADTRVIVIFNTEATDFDADFRSKRFPRYIENEMDILLSNDDRITVLERDKNRLDALNKEILFELSGGVSENRAHSLGDLLEGEYLILCEMTDIGDYYRFRMKPIDLSTGKLKGALALNISKGESITSFLVKNKDYTKVN
jgi:hypothetical protein